MKSNTQTTAELYDPTADEITAHILGYLRSKGYVCWAQDNRGRYNPKTQRWYPHPNNRVGVPDIIGYRKSDARFIGVEVKAGSDRLSSYHIEFLNELKEHGGLPFVAHSFEGFVASFERRGLHLVATTAAPGRPPKPKPAYLCQGSNSHAYHSTTRCDGLAWCTRNVTKTTEAQAKKLGRYPCGRCH